MILYVHLPQGFWFGGGVKAPGVFVLGMIVRLGQLFSFKMLKIQAWIGVVKVGPQLLVKETFNLLRVPSFSGSRETSLTVTLHAVFVLSGRCGWEPCRTQLCRIASRMAAPDLLFQLEFQRCALSQQVKSRFCSLNGRRGERCRFSRGDSDEFPGCDWSRF